MITIEVHGLKRSGHHAVINWLVANLPNSMFVNMPIQSVRMVKGREVCFVATLQSLLTDIDEINRLKVWHVVTGSSNPGIVIYNLEDSRLDSDPFIFTQGKQPDFKVLVLRDPYNNFASRIKVSKSYDYAGERDTVVNIWREHALEFMNPCSSFVKVNYNKWFASQDYRESIGKRLGFSSDLGREHVAEWGGGSSFDGRLYEGCAHKMKVLTRYKQFLKDKSFLDLFDSQIQQITKDIFGLCPIGRLF